jgi:hypothetical protein
MKTHRLGAFLCAALAGSYAAASAIAVYVNGTPVRFPVGQPMEMKGHVMVPLRGVFEEMGGNVQWDQAAQMVTIAKGDVTIKMTVGEAHALKNEETIVTQVKSVLQNGTVYVPLRFLAETLDAQVQWNGAERSVSITTVKAVAAPSTQRKPPPPQ